MDTKHTRGPWVGAGKRGIDGGEYGYDEVVSATCDPCGWSGCSGARVVMTDADERLIAAAPDLLESLQALGAKPNGYCFCLCAEHVAAGHTGECRDACAAIAKTVGP